ncbi:MAG: metallophosphoesterase [Candidatus Eremiobacteraeota bacterium]|nr:metallophosphoesterase [Candidatus Eremiobacteraeota bacterium]
MNGAKRVVIYHTSDIHGRLEFGERLASIVEPGALLVDCGDALAGSSVFYVADEEVIEDLARAPYAALAVGNREFHYLHRLFLARARKLPAPLVCSNLIDLRRREEVFKREVTVEVNHTPVRILSLLVPQYRTGSGWEKVFGWRFLAPDAALEEMIGSQKRITIPTIVLSHLGLAADRELAARWPGLAAILGGHTHEALWQPDLINSVPIAHPGAYASQVGRLVLSIENGTSRMAAYQLLPLLRTESEEAQERMRDGVQP